MSDRVYRKAEFSDLPKIHSGQLKAYSSLAKWPAKLVSSRYGHKSEPLFILEGELYDSITMLNEICVDITPTYKYAIWNHKMQRFVMNDGSRTVMIFSAEIAAKVYLGGFQRINDYTDESMKRFYITKFEVPNEL